MGFVLALPLMIVVLIVYNLMAFVNMSSLEAHAFTIPMISEPHVGLTWGDLVVYAGLLLLFVEVLKSARASNTAIVDHILSMAVFIAALVEFLLVPQARTAIFLTLVILCLIDVVSGYTVSIHTARRDFTFDRELQG
jgi:hypothetical protein